METANGESVNGGETAVLNNGGGKGEERSGGGVGGGDGVEKDVNQNTESALTSVDRSTTDAPIDEDADTGLEGHVCY